ncbi:MAG: LOG family protein [bacterium]|nr:LOG family protein [bacterium]
MKQSDNDRNHPVKAYENLEFLNSPDARSIRVLCELMQPRIPFRNLNVHNTVVFFGSARTLPYKQAAAKLRESEIIIAETENPAHELFDLKRQAETNVKMSRYYEEAASLAEKITAWSMEIQEPHKRFFICSGGGPGIMEAANLGAKKAGGKSIGLNISLPYEQEPNPFQTPSLSFEFHYFFIRKFWFFYLAKAMVVFPGGYGTLDEFFELLTLVQTEKTKKYMPIILYGQDYWKRVLNFEAMVEYGTISPEDLNLFTIMDDVDSAFEHIKRELTEHHLG